MCLIKAKQNNHTSLHWDEKEIPSMQQEQGNFPLKQYKAGYHLTGPLEAFKKRVVEKVKEIIKV